ncbi:hypothetical protein [Cohnella sp. AR92]|uniref:hypothetical protein n=1 Tax=Cohnella sp. AR92 TaxID=648716 RepID=UPI000F8D6C0A|nr:hypothetical protein [Cohnella sp. AR92]RUS45000.1 hypothetical protein ELR57_22355 [Cohnella sp. AR92]
MTKPYSEVVKDLKERFPNGTVVNNRFIPNQVYIDRLEAATESEWSKEILRLDIRPEAGYVCAIVRVKIGDYHRDGYKVEKIKPGADDKALTTAIDLAVNGALVTAIDDWQVGWINLAETGNRDWATNPGITLLQAEKANTQSTKATGAAVPSSSTRNCSNCRQQLTVEDIDYLKTIPKLKIDFCRAHVPKFYLKNKN